ncbi:MAG: MFS transporter [Clostridia bacterium]|nr:MFS transporter [Clostridia bacterium]
MEPKDTAERRREHGRIFILCFTIYAFSYIGRMNYSACIPSIINEGIFDRAFGGYITTAYLIAYGAGQLINGYVSTRISPRYMIGIGLAGVAVSNLFMGIFPYKYAMVVIWAFNGFFNSMLWTPLIRAFTDWLPEKPRARAGVNISVSIPLGTLAAYLIPALILKHFDWRTVFFVCSGCLFLAFIIWCVGMRTIKDYLAEIAKCETTPPGGSVYDHSGSDVRDGFGRILIRMCVPLVAIICFFNGALKDSVTSWTPTYLFDTFSINDFQASLITTLLPIVSVFGAYVARFLDDRFFKNELAVCGVLYGIAAIAYIALNLFGHTNVILSAALISIALSAMWGVNTQVLTFIPFYFNKLHKSSAISGMLNCTAYIASSTCSSVFGTLAESVGWSAVTAIWLGIAIAGTVASFVIAPIWKKRRNRYS